MPDSCTCSCATTRRRRRPTATLVIASLALFMSLGGTSYAAVKAKSIGNKQLKNNAVTSGKIARNGVTASDIRAAVIDGTKIKAGAIDGTKIKAGSITSKHILDRSIGAQDIQPGSIGAKEIANGSIGPTQIADGSLQEGDISGTLITKLRGVPTTLAAAPGPASQIISEEGGPNAFTTIRSDSPSAAQTGTNFIQANTSVTSSSGATVRCWISVNGTPQARSTVTIAPNATVVVPVTTVAPVPAAAVVQSRCDRLTNPGSEAVADLTALASSMTLMRVGD
jgi:hypothetical protein